MTNPEWNRLVELADEATDAVGAGSPRGNLLIAEIMEAARRATSTDDKHDIIALLERRGLV